MGLEAQRESGVQGGSVVELERKRKTGSERGVGMEVFRDSLWTDSDMGTHSGPNEAWQPLADFTGLGQRDRGRDVKGMWRHRSGTDPTF